MSETSAVIDVHTMQSHENSVKPGELVALVRKSFNNGHTRRVEFRRQQLKLLHIFLVKHEEEICEAMQKDLRKPILESMLLEVDYLKNEIVSVLQHLDEWTRRQKAEKTMANFLDDLWIYPEPYGVVLVMGAWNYPLQLTLLPVVGAIAAGNCVIIKPSDISVNTSNLLASLLPQYLDTKCYPVFLGGPDETTLLLQQQFDYIFFTGSSTIGRIVHKAAAQHLTPTTLELGGKSPCYIDDTADIATTTKRILWGKLVNAGQTCIAPDYILCTPKVQTALIEEAKKILAKFYGDDIKSSPDLCRIITQRHFERLIRLMDGLDIALGGDYDPKDNYIAPTIARNVSPNDLIMQEEIFGPILPIMPIENVDEAIAYVNRNEKPLALYIFTKRKSVSDLILAKTSSGGVCINDTLMHVAPAALPFGGVGNSGMGAYHGKSTFDVFTHYRSVLRKSFGGMGEMAMKTRYPPYSKGNLKLMTMALKTRPGIKFGFVVYLLVFLVGMLVSYLILTYAIQ